MGCSSGTKLEFITNRLYIDIEYIVTGGTFIPTGEIANSKKPWYL